jgi:hypothetical protein
MTLPVYDIDDVKASHRKYQIITIFFTFVTLAATLGAAFSGIQWSKLEQERLNSKEVVAQEPSPPKAPAIADDAAMKEIEALKAALAQEKSSALKMKAKIKDLNNQISALEKAVVAARAPRPSAAPKAHTPKPEPAPTPHSPKSEAAPVTHSVKPEPAPTTQSKPAAPHLPLQKEEPAATPSPPAPPQLQPQQEATSPPESTTESNNAEEPSAAAPIPSNRSDGGVSPKPVAAPPSEQPAKEAVTPPVDATAKPIPATEADQTTAAPQVVAPPHQPPSATDQPAPTNTGEPESKANP